MPHRVNDDFFVAGFIEDQIRIRGYRHTSHGGIAGACAYERVSRKSFNGGLNSRLNTARALWRMAGDETENVVEVRERPKRIADLHKPCFAQTARTCASSANSPRAAAAL